MQLKTDFLALDELAAAEAELQELDEQARELLVAAASGNGRDSLAQLGALMDKARAAALKGGAAGEQKAQAEALEQLVSEEIAASDAEARIIPLRARVAQLYDRILKSEQRARGSRADATRKRRALTRELRATQAIPAAVVRELEGRVESSEAAVSAALAANGAARKRF